MERGRKGAGVQDEVKSRYKSERAEEMRGDVTEHETTQAEEMPRSGLAEVGNRALAVANTEKTEDPEPIETNITDSDEAENAEGLSVTQLLRYCTKNQAYRLHLADLEGKLPAGRLKKFAKSTESIKQKIREKPQTDLSIGRAFEHILIDGSNQNGWFDSKARPDVLSITRGTTEYDDLINRVDAFVTFDFTDQSSKYLSKIVIGIDATAQSDTQQIYNKILVSQGANDNKALPFGYAHPEAYLDYDSAGPVMLPRFVVGTSNENVLGSLKGAVVENEALLFDEGNRAFMNAKFQVLSEIHAGCLLYRSMLDQNDSRSPFLDKQLTEIQELMADCMDDAAIDLAVSNNLPNDLIRRIAQASRERTERPGQIVERYFLKESKDVPVRTYRSIMSNLRGLKASADGGYLDEFNPPQDRSRIF